jgi:hypothetical protein
MLGLLPLGQLILTSIILEITVIILSPEDLAKQRLINKFTQIFPLNSKKKQRMTGKVEKNV